MITRMFRRNVEAVIRALNYNPYDWAGWVPIITQSGNVTFTAEWAKYLVQGRSVTLQVQLKITGSGTTTNDIVISNLPFNSVPNSTGFTVGIGTILDTGTAWYAGLSVIMVTGGSIKFRYPSSNEFVGTSPNFGLASDDYIYFTAVYEKA